MSRERFDGDYLMQANEYTWTRRSLPIANKGTRVWFCFVCRLIWKSERENDTTTSTEVSVPERERSMCVCLNVYIKNKGNDSQRLSQNNDLVISQWNSYRSHSSLVCYLEFVASLICRKCCIFSSTKKSLKLSRAYHTHPLQLLKRRCTYTCREEEAFDFLPECVCEFFTSLDAFYARLLLLFAFVHMYYLFASIFMLVSSSVKR